MSIDLRGKPIFITGASSGIGAATALECARAGMPVYLTARREEQLRAVADTCAVLGVRAEIETLDVRDEQACAAAIERAEQTLGPLHAVFANAGYGFEAPTWSVSDAQAREIFDVNYFGTLNVVRAAAPRFIDRGAGHVLLCSSCLAIFPTPRYAHYSATKGAQHHIGRALGVELRPMGVRVSTVYPVGTKTEFFDESARRSDGAPVISRAPEGARQPPERVARAIVGALRRPKPEVWTRQSVRLLFATLALTPRFTERMLARTVRRASLR